MGILGKKMETTIQALGVRVGYVIPLDYIEYGVYGDLMMGV